MAKKKPKPKTNWLHVARQHWRCLVLLTGDGMDRFELAEQIGVSPRVVSRYIDWLVEHGVPVQSEQSCQTCKSVWFVAWEIPACVEWWNKLMAGGDK